MKNKTLCRVCNSDRIKAETVIYPVPNPEQEYDTTTLTVNYESITKTACMDCGHVEVYR